MSPRIPITPEIAEKMRQFEIVAKVGIQTGVCGLRCRNGELGKKISILQIGMRDFDLSRVRASTCLARAQDFMERISTSISSETLLIAERRRQLRVLKRAA